MGRDLITRPYGRFYHIPLLLTQKGHHCTILLLSYKNEPEIAITQDGIRWISINLGKLPGYKFIKTANTLIKSEKIDWVIGFSDIYFGIAAQYVASKNNIKSIVDAYDNYESYISWLKPLHLLWRRAIKKATTVTAAGPSLASLMSKYRANKDITIAPMAADPIFKTNHNKTHARTILNLPVDELLIGYCGSIYNNRGISILFDAYKIISEKSPTIRLVLSGRIEKNIQPPDNCILLGYLPDEQLPSLLNAMDLLVVINTPGNFGDYSYPVKLYEALQSETPVIASDTPSIRWILGGNNKILVKTGNAQALAESIILNLQDPTITDRKSGWIESAEIFHRLINNQ